MMGYVTSGGSLARMVGPPAATWAYSAASFRTYPLFLTAAALMLPPLALAIVWRVESPYAGPPAGPTGEDGGPGRAGGVGAARGVRGGGRQWNHGGPG